MTTILLYLSLPFLPLTGVHHNPPMNFSQYICNFTKKGREKIHSNQKVVDEANLEALQLYFNKDETTEFRSNAISRYVAQYGKCYVTGERLTPQNSVIIRIVPKERNRKHPSRRRKTEQIKGMQKNPRETRFPGMPARSQRTVRYRNKMGNQRNQNQMSAERMRRRRQKKQA